MERLQQALVALLQLIARAIVKRINFHALSGFHKTDNYRLSDCYFRCADDTNCISQCARGLASCQGSTDRDREKSEYFGPTQTEWSADQAVRRSLLLALNTVLAMKSVRVDVHATATIQTIAMMLVSLITMTWITTSVAVLMTSVQ